MGAELAIRVRGLSKRYTISHDSRTESTLAETMLKRLRSPRSPRLTSESFWALQDVDFDINRGDVVGIIGRNGAGKSTLLKILSRITGPTSGTIELYGRIGSLLEVGTGFHPELTGRENIFLNGAILGMSREEIRRQFDAIVDFAGVQRFLDTPVKRYSSGMYVRLAFAVAAHLRSEILIIDEVLAVGDAEFQDKCLGKMRDVAGSGRTVLFVSHHMQSVAALCTRAILLSQGTVIAAGGVDNVLDAYLQQRERTGTSPTARRSAGGSGEVRIVWAEVAQSTVASTDDIDVTIELDSVKPDVDYFVSMQVVNCYGASILHLDSRLLNRQFRHDGQRRVTYKIRSPRLAQGTYGVDVFVCGAAGVFDRMERAAEFTVSPLLPYPSPRGDIANMAMIYPDFTVGEAEPCVSNS